MIGTHVDDGVRLCLVRGWVLGRVWGGRGRGVMGIGGAIGGMFRLRPRGRVEMREVRKWGGITLMNDLSAVC